MKFKLTLMLALACMILASSYRSEFSAAPKVKFHEGNYDDFLRQAKKSKKPVLLDFWASWCGPCRKMDNETFSNPDFANYLNQNFMVYKVNIDTFDGMEIADRFAVDAYPTLVMLDSKGKMINRYKGFYPANYLENELNKDKDQKGKRFVAPKNTAMLTGQ
jgi:thioredoxin 1